MAESSSGWATVVSALVWPFLIAALVFFYRSYVSSLLHAVSKRVLDGAPVKIAGFLELGEIARATEVGNVRINDVAVSSVAGEYYMAEKGSEAFLEELKSIARTKPARRIDILKVTNGEPYSPRLLTQYVSTLGIRYVVFESNGKFEGWADAGLVVGQLRPNASYDYGRIKSDVAGITNLSVKPTDSLSAVLERMQESHVEALAVVDANSHFRSIVTKSDILAKLVAGLVTRSPASTQEGPAAGAPR
jgi:CBS domain-containing protein